MFVEKGLLVQLVMARKEWHMSGDREKGCPLLEDLNPLFHCCRNQLWTPQVLHNTAVASFVMFCRKTRLLSFLTLSVYSAIYSASCCSVHFNWYCH